MGQIKSINYSNSDFISDYSISETFDSKAKSLNDLEHVKIKCYVCNNKFNIMDEQNIDDKAIYYKIQTRDRDGKFKVPNLMILMLSNLIDKMYEKSSSTVKINSKILQFILGPLTNSIFKENKELFDFFDNNISDKVISNRVFLNERYRVQVEKLIRKFSEIEAASNKIKFFIKGVIIKNKLSMYKYDSDIKDFYSYKSYDSSEIPTLSSDILSANKEAYLVSRLNLNQISYDLNIEYIFNQHSFLVYNNKIYDFNLQEAKSFYNTSALTVDQKGLKKIKTFQNYQMNFEKMKTVFREKDLNLEILTVKEPKLKSKIYMIPEELSQNIPEALQIVNKKSQDRKGFGYHWNCHVYLKEVFKTLQDIRRISHDLI